MNFKNGPMKKPEGVNLKLVVILTATVFTMGCSIITEQGYSPRRTSGWKTYTWKQLGSPPYQYECNGSSVGIYGIRTKPLSHTDKPRLAIDIYNPKGLQEACKLSILWLENTKTGQRVNPLKVEAGSFGDKTTARCYYSFDIQGDKNVRYDLHISDHLLGCPIEPIPYVFEKTWEIQPQDVM